MMCLSRVNLSVQLSRVAVGAPVLSRQTCFRGADKNKSLAAKFPSLILSVIAFVQLPNVITVNYVYISATYCNYIINTAYQTTSHYYEEPKRKQQQNIHSLFHFV